MARDIRSNEDHIDSPTIREDTSWTTNIPQDDVKPYTTQVPTALPMSAGGGGEERGIDLVDAGGRPMSMKGLVSKTHDEIDILWERKKAMEPCWLCIHFKKDKVSPEDKLLFFQLLAKEHGWREEWVSAELGNPDAYEYCDVYETLTHKNASCPRLGVFKKRDI